MFDVRDDRFGQVVAQDAQLEQVVTGFEFTEGPIWHPVEKHLTFSDIIGNTMYRWSENNGLRVFRQPSNMANGNTYDRDGRLVTCEHATSRVTRTEPDGRVMTLASHYGAKELNSPNDIVSNGMVRSILRTRLRVEVRDMGSCVSRSCRFRGFIA